MKKSGIVAVLSLLALAAACSSGKSDDQLKKQLAEFSKSLDSGPSANSRGAAKSGDPCSLLNPSEVAAAIGPLAAPPYLGDYEPSARGSSCRYETKDHRRILVSVDWSDGPIEMKMMRMGRALTDAISKNGERKIGVTVLASGDTLVGDWDEIAEGPMQCCDLHALRGDQQVELDWTGTRLTAVAAGALLDSAINRLDRPLAINGAAGLPAALQLYAADAKDSVVNICALMPQAVVESALGRKLTGPPRPGTPPMGARECTYPTTTPGGGMPTEYDVSLAAWRDGAIAFAEDQFVVAMAGHAMRRQLAGDTTAVRVDTAAHPVGPWDEAGYMSSPGFEAVK
ncbi:MAG: hypothetical protein ABI311_02490, partial [Gemmatimonadaceae bacterium]